jgi:uncharacterized damage-inducible protein DinB
MTGRHAEIARFAAYNAWANRHLYAAAGRLGPEALRARRPAAFFTSILGTLNHLLVADRIWLDRFEGRTPAHGRLNEIVHDDLGELEAARRDEDARIQAFVEGLSERDLDATLTYRRSDGTPQGGPLGPHLAHVFNHQTHHRGQAHALLLEAGLHPPQLDYISYLRETGAA